MYDTDLLNITNVILGTAVLGMLIFIVVAAIINCRKDKSNKSEGI